MLPKITKFDSKTQLINKQPSSPRQFFARIYGHLENETTTTTKTEKSDENVNINNNNTIIDILDTGSSSNSRSESGTDSPVSQDHKHNLKICKKYQNLSFNNSSVVSGANHENKLLPQMFPSIVSSMFHHQSNIGTEINASSTNSTVVQHGFLNSTTVLGQNYIGGPVATNDIHFSAGFSAFCKSLKYYLL